MRTYDSPQFANKAVVLAGLLASILFVGMPRQVRAESPAAVTAAPSAAASGRMVTLAQHTPGKVLNGTATRIGHYNPEQKLRLALVVQPPKMAEEEQFLKHLTTKGDPNFHKFLSAEEWNARFGPSIEDEQKVVDWARSQGFTVTQRYPNRLIVDVEAPAATIEAALSVTINNYRVDDEVDFSNDRDPQIPASLSGIVNGVLGLNSIHRVHGFMPQSRKMKGPDYVEGPVINKNKPAQGAGDPAKAPWNRKTRLGADAAAADVAEAPRVVSPDGIVADSQTVSPFWIFSSQAYNYDGLYNMSHCCNVPGNSGGAPPESSIALVTFGNFKDSDVQAFFNYYGFAWSYDSYVIGGATAPAQDDEAPGDLEYATATSNSFGAPADTAHVAVFEIVNGLFSSYADAYEAIASDNVARVISTSYGSAEEDWDQDGYATGTGTGQFHGIFNSLAGEGYTMVASAGDSGSAQDCINAVQVNWPASDPNFIAAGGTALQLDSSGNYVSEVAWTGDTWSGACADNWGGGGGGESALFSQPSWQNGPIPSSTMRLLPDISLNASPDVTWEQYYYNGGWSSFDGTSVVAPELAGFFAQENAYLDYVGNICGDGTMACSPMGNPAPLIYDNGESGANHNPFYDITSGCNSNDITALYGLTTYCAVQGYDEATGWGSVNMMQLAWGINYELIPAFGNPSIAFTGPTVNTWNNASQPVSWTVSDAGSGNFPPSGVAGYTSGWDSIPPDSFTKPGGGSGDSFYTGPEYPFETTGSLTFNAGTMSQGCHTAQVEGWDNQGFTTTGSYGPICYDTVAPTITISNNPIEPVSTWWNTSVAVTLTPTDPGGANASGIYKTYYGVDSPGCVPGSAGSCSVYTAPFTISAQGAHTVEYWTQDVAGNTSTQASEPVKIDLTPPATTASLSGTLSHGNYYSNVQVALTASDTLSGVQSTLYEVDGAATPSTYTGSAFSVTGVASHSVKYWSVDNAGNTETVHTVSFTITGLPATMTSPSAASVLGTTSVTFTWAAGQGTTEYNLWLGLSGPGSSSLYASGWLTTTSATVPTIPGKGATVYARLYSMVDGVQVYNDYVYTEKGAATMSTPAPGSTLGATGATFTWTKGYGASTYQLFLGTTGLGSSDIYSSVPLTATSVTVPSIPANGSTVYARLTTTINGLPQFYDYTYTESAPAPATMSTPVQGSTLGVSNVKFTWNAGIDATEYNLYVGLSGPGSSSLYAAGWSAAMSATVPSLPAKGATVYARLYSMVNGKVEYNDYTYTEAPLGVPAAMTTPVQGSTLGTSNVAFTWNAGIGATSYNLYLGTNGPGSSSLYASGWSAAMSATVPSLPAKGATVYARLYSKVNGNVEYNDYTYTEAVPAGSPATMLSPTPGSTLGTSGVVFTWTTGTGATEYNLYLGTSAPGSSSLNSSGWQTTTTWTAPSIPAKGVPVYARLYSMVNGAIQYNDYTYVEQ